MFLRQPVIGAQAPQRGVRLPALRLQHRALRLARRLFLFQRLQIRRQRRQPVQGFVLLHRLPPLFAPIGQAAAIQRRLRRRLRLLQGSVGFSLQPLRALAVRGMLGQRLRVAPDLFVRRRQLRGAALALLLQAARLREAGAPALQQFAQPRMVTQPFGGGLLRVQFGLLRVQALALGLLQPARMAQRQPVTSLPFPLQLLPPLLLRQYCLRQPLLFLARQAGFTPRRLQPLRRLVAAQAFQLRLRLRFALAGLPPGLLGAGAVPPRLFRFLAKLPALPRLFPGLLRPRRGRAPLRQPRRHLLALRGVQQLHPVCARLPLLQLQRASRALEHPLRDQAVDFAAGQFFQQFGARVGIGVEKGGETALRQQHGFGETRVIQAGDVFDAFELVRHLAAEDFAIGVGQFHLGACSAPSALSRARRWLQNAR